jgi:CRP-like cAMP-binding protein
MASAMVDTKLLSQTEIFEGLDEDILGDVACYSKCRRLDRGDVLFLTGDRPDAMYVVLSGLIAIVTTAPDGRDSVISLMEEGDLFGEMGFFDGRGRSAGARALEASEVLTVPYGPVRRLYEIHPERLWRVVSMLVRRLRAAGTALADSVFLDVVGRTAKRLLTFAGDEDSFTLPVTQEELAAMVGASRERVNKAISQFVRLGWLERSGHHYIIRDRPQLTLRSR